MKKYIYLIVMLLLCVKALAQGHIPGTVLPAVPTTAPWNVYTAAPDQRQNAAVTNAQSLALVPTGTNGTDIFVTYNVNTTGYNFYLVYTTNGSVPTKTNGTVVNMSFAVFSASNRIWAGKIPQQPAGTVVNYVIYVNTTGGTLAAANNRVSSAVFGIESSWTEGNRYYTFIASGGVPGPSLWLKADAGTNTTINGNAVTTWNDQSGNLRNVSSSSPGNGVVNYNTASGNSEFNFNPSINFDNTNDALGTSTALFPPVGGPNATFFGVSNKDGAALLQVNISGSGGSGAQSYDWPQFDSNGIFARYDTFNGWSAGYSSTGTRVANGYINAGTGAGVGRGFSSNGGSFVTDGNWCFLGELGFVIGSDQVSGDNATAVNNTSEVIAYQRQLSALEKRRIDSYLAIKYGVTLSQTTPQNYLSSAGSTIWDATTVPNPSYSNNIAGIARDDASGLNQYQSQSMNAGIQPVIALGNIFATNQANTNTFSTDLSALVWGSDTGSTSFATSFAFGGLNNRMVRIWKVQETGTVGTVKVALRASDISSNITLPSLVVSSDATFDGSDAKTSMTLETLGGVSYYTATVDFTTGQFFTFAALVTAPGGVLGTTLWLKADAGTSTITNGAGVAQWNDQSANGNNMVQATGASQPRFADTPVSNINFNPSVDFNGTNQNMVDSNGIFGTGTYSNSASFAIANTDAVQNGVLYVESLGVGSWFAQNIPWGDGNFYWQGPQSAALSASWGGTIGVPYLWTGWNNNSLSPRNVLRRNGLTLGSNNTAVSYTGNNSQFVLGSNNGNINYFDGRLGELIIYTNPFTAVDRQKVESYLAVKYGVTLNQTSAQNYVNSSGSTIWDATTLPNPSYSNNIAGIARDDASALNQKQSSSVNTGLQPVIALGNIFATNQANTNTFAADLSALVWGSDTGSTSFATPFAFGGLNNRMARIWRVQETGTVGTVKVALRVSDLPLNVTIPALVVSSDATFDGTDSRTAMTLETLGGVQYYTATVDFTTGQFFTFAALVTAPGGVSAGLTIWHKADAGVTASSNLVTAWTNLPNGRQVINTGGSQSPTLTNGTTGALFNFNPYLNFTATPNALYDSGATPFTQGGSGTFFFTANNLSSGGQMFGVNATGGTGVNIYDNPVFETDRMFTSPSSFAYSPSTSLLPTSIQRLTFTPSNVTGQLNMSGTNFLNVAPTSVLGGGGYIFGADNSGLGGDDNGFTGLISETVAYNTTLSATDINKVNSYLAIKYGVTLGTSSSVVNYLASNGASIWTGDTTYQNNIAGIMRDDASGLNQDQSQSANSGIQPVIALGNIFATNQANTNTFAADLSALVWGSDAGSTSFATPFVFGGSTVRMARIWKVQETGTVGTVKVALRASDISGGASAPALLVSSDAVFDGTDSRTAMTLETLGGVQYYTATVDFTTGQFFTFAALVTAPGGVSGASLWVKADAGVGNTTYFNVPSGNRTASSSFSGLGPANSTLSSGTSWSAATATTGDFLTLDLGSSQTVRGVVTKGRGDSFAQWVTSYIVGYSTDNVNYVSLGSFNGNVDQVTEVVSLFPSAVTARYIRFTVAGYSGFPSMRADVVSTLTNATADNTAINFWNDQSGNGRNFVNVTANPVLYQTTASNSSFNFNPSLNFGATTAALGSGSTLFPASPVSSATFFGVTNVGGFLFLGVNNNLETVNTAKYDYPLFGNGYVYARINSGAAVNPTVTPASGTSISTGYLSNGTSAGIASNGGNFSVLSGSYGTYTGAMSIGSNQWANGDNANPAVGNIPELIAFNQQLTAPQRLQVESYLATKYGITLNQTTAQNYLASDGSTITWNATANSSYKNNIAGIGRDDLTALYQKQSQSINSGSQVVMALGTVAASNQANANTIPVNNQFFIWGDDNGSLSTFVSTGNITYPSRFTRIWKTQNTGGFAQNMTVYYPVSAFGTSVASSVGILYGNTAASLSDGSASIILQSGTTTINGVSHYAFTVPAAQVANMQFFSFSGSIVCYKPAVTVGTTLDTKHGITALGRAGSGDPDNWPMVRKGAWTVLEAKTKGFVINRLTAAQIAAIPPANLVEGMMIYDTTNNCMKVYTSTDGGTTFNWQCISTQTCPD